MNATLKHTAMAAGLCAVTGLQPALAADETTTYQEEPLGVGIGAVVGAAVAGPAGLVVGAAVGGLGGRHMGTQQELQATQQRLAEVEAAHQRRERALALSRERVGKLEKALAKQSVQAVAYQQGRAEDRRQYGEALQAISQGFAFAVPFRTDSAELEARYRRRLARMAAAVRSVPELEVHLAGHADPRGSDDYNQTLSRRRVEAVRARLIDAGLPTERIAVAAHGERRAEYEADREGWFFDRRVVVRFRTGEEQSL